ncbi:369_t:CDS:2 [Paraglomus occultum]|uniref:Phosphoribosylaminoimidazole-succinocarboxamide synthase n=1 Tax=Paraglomus occultum TaxID=144539 RepID=A0A9N9AMR9_9GLOM|nr:369_t:CDS:2 [Paraglomus occultum]
MTLLYTNCPDLELVTRGKVRDIYRVDESSLLLVTTDRLSAFDVIMKNGVPGKGKILTQISKFWFDYLGDVIPNHLICSEFSQMPEKVQKYKDQLEHRSLLVRSLQVFPIEAIVRGYITGSAWAEYKKTKTVCGIQLPDGLQESQKFDAPLYTPSTKAEIGQHDENIHPDKAKEIVGDNYAEIISKTAVELYSKASDYALKKGIIIADTKFEFGKDKEGNVILVDEVLTPDSSRFWSSANYRVGIAQESIDKQFVRNYLLSINYDKKTSIELPEDIVQKTAEKYVEAYRLLTGSEPTFL